MQWSWECFAPPLFLKHGRKNNIYILMVVIHWEQNVRWISGRVLLKGQMSWDLVHECRDRHYVETWIIHLWLQARDSVWGVDIGRLFSAWYEFTVLFWMPCVNFFFFWWSTESRVFAVNEDKEKIVRVRIKKVWNRVGVWIDQGVRVWLPGQVEGAVEVCG